MTAIEVFDPQLIDEGSFGGSFVRYSLRTTAARPDWPVGDSVVHRRFRDFQWLDAALKFSYPGAIRPPLPPTMSGKLFGDDEAFVEDRRQRLAQYLSACLAHPELQASPQLRAFATLSAADAWLAYQRNQPTSKSSSSSAAASSASRRSTLAPSDSLSPAKDSMSAKDSLLRPTLLSPNASDAGEVDHDSSSSKPSIWQGEPSEAELGALEVGVGGSSPEPSALDLEFAAEAQALTPLQAQLTSVAQALAASVTKQSALAEALNQSSAAYGQLVEQEDKLEPANGVTAEALRAMGQACSALAKLVAATAADDDARSRQPLEYEAALLERAQQALGQQRKLRHRAQQSRIAWLAAVAKKAGPQQAVVDAKLALVSAGVGMAETSVDNASSANSTEVRALLEQLMEVEDQYDDAKFAVDAAAIHAVQCARVADACNARICRELDRAARTRKVQVRLALAGLCQRRASHAADTQSIWLSLAPVLDAHRLALDPDAAAHAFTQAHSAAASLSDASQPLSSGEASASRAAVDAATASALAATAEAAAAAGAVPADVKGDVATGEDTFGAPAGFLPHSGVQASQGPGQRKPAMSEDWHNSSAYNEASV